MGCLVIHRNIHNSSRWREFFFFFEDPVPRLLKTERK